MWIIFKFFGLLLAWNHWLSVKGNRSKKNPSEIYKSDLGSCQVFYERRSLVSKRTVLGLPLKRGSRFKIHPELPLDKLLKSLGFSTELQTGNVQFDRKVYLESDAEVLAEEIRDNPRAQEIIIALFKDLAEKIVADGEWLEVHYYGEKRDHNLSADLLIELGKFFDSVPSKRYGLFRDPNFYKAASFEFMITGYAFYGGISLIQWFRNSTIIDAGGLIKGALVLSIFLITALILLNRTIFSKSSRGHKILVENFFYILLGVPIASFFLLSDLNQSLDSSQPESYDVRVIGRRHRFYGRNLFTGRLSSSYRWRPYYLRVDLSPLKGYNFSKSIKVSWKNYSNSSGSVNIEVGRGYFNQRYIKKVNF